ncbi:DMT family transporter [Leptolyngbya sp. PCC 6406]|uniref:DMT family transporter n=1 Tax=Leptolyngbya sp. PCC 6406 TaxID=1173264 RepID=UPI0002ACD373|nr:DMT family transporter [Leptolyngbya sp. PCC 6406]
MRHRRGQLPMGQMDNGPENSNQDARAILHSVTQDLQTLQARLSDQLTRDVDYLQGAKARLLRDLESLEAEYQSLQARYDALQTDYDVSLSQQQVAQQQLWAKRLAQALATHLKSRLTESMYGALAASGNGQTASVGNAYQLLASLDSTLNDTLHSLQQDLNSYQSSLSQQVSRMHSMEQQGEAILEALVNRLSQQLQTQMVRPPARVAPTDRSTNGYDRPQSLPYPSPGRGDLGGASNGTSRSLLTPDGRSTPAASAPKKASAFQQGLILIILSTLALSFHNVIVGIIGYGGNLLGQIPIDGIFALNIPNSLMLLWLRMLVVLPLMAIIAGRIYPNVWRDIREFLGAQDKRPLYQVMASGGFLFMSQVLIYKAISEIGPGVAVTLLFMYPLITVPLAWFLFGDRPSSLRAVVMFAITVGIVFTALPRISADLAVSTVSPWGVVSALLSSGAFALYLIAMQLSFKRLHPVPVSLFQFATIFILASLILIGGSFVGLEVGQPSSFSGLYGGGILLGGLTLMGYLFNNFGVRLMGAAQASIVASSGPVLTALLAYLLTPGEKSTLQFIQWIGVVLVTVGVLALSFERLNNSGKPSVRSRRG